MVSEQLYGQLCYWAEFVIWLDLNHRVAQWSFHVVWVCCQFEKQTHLTHLLRAMQVLCLSNSCSFQSCCPTLLISLLLLWCSKKTKENYINQFFFLDSLSFLLSRSVPPPPHPNLFYLPTLPPVLSLWNSASLNNTWTPPPPPPPPTCLLFLCVTATLPDCLGNLYLKLTIEKHWTD